MIHDLAEERSRLWALQSSRPTQDRSDRIVQLTRMLNGHADDIIDMPAPLWDIEQTEKRQSLDYARPGGVSQDRRKEACTEKARRSSQVPGLRPPE